MVIPSLFTPADQLLSSGHWKEGRKEGGRCFAFSSDPVAHFILAYDGQATLVGHIFRQFSSKMSASDKDPAGMRKLRGSMRKYPRHSCFERDGVGALTSNIWTNGMLNQDFDAALTTTA